VEKTEKIVKKSGMFFVSKNDHQLTTFYHAFHHDLTIEKPRSTRHFFQNTPQKHQQRQQNPGSRQGLIFFLK
jgi:hypothetical protein